jgi:hypothetical protein
MGKAFSNYLFFAVIIVLIVSALKFMNWIPMMIQTETMRRYDNIHEIRTKLNIKEIHVPSYYPQQLSWPPSEILAQNKPFPAIVMKFRHGETGESILFVAQTRGDLNLLSDNEIIIVNVKEKADYSLKGRNAELMVGLCREGNACSQITWQEGEYSILVAMKSGPFDLIRIAESMLRDNIEVPASP